MIDWNNKHIDAVIRHLESYRTTGSDGQVDFNSGFAVHTLLSVVRSSVEFSDELTEEERTSIIDNGFWQAARAGPLTVNSLKAGINRALNEFKQQALLDYVIVTNVSIPTNMPLRRKRIRGATVSFPTYSNKKYTTSRYEAVQRAQSFTSFEDPLYYRLVRVSGTSARTESAVVQQSVECIDLLRGIWNLFWNRQATWRISTGRRKPVNHYVRGPFLTIHFRDGSAASDQFYYEPNFTRVDLRPVSRRDFGAMIKFEGNVRSRLRRHPFRPFLEGAFVRYAQALDEANWELSFLKMWGLLEMLTNTSAKKGYDSTIRRASFLWLDANFSRAILEQLREYRNSWVHKQRVTDEMETNLYNLKNHVEHLINYHLVNRHGFGTLEESCSVLDLPTSVETLKNRKRLYDLGIKYRDR